MKIIPAIDIIGGKCVRLTRGDYLRKKIYANDPVEVAKSFENVGIQRLHLVDLDGAKRSEVVNYDVLEKIASKTNLIIDFGGGIKSNEIIERIFNAGAHIASIGSIAIKEKELFRSWVEIYGEEKILLGADVRKEKITISGWLEKTEISVFDFIRENAGIGVKNVFCTDVAMDGNMRGPSIELYKRIIKDALRINLIASGGVSCVNDLVRLKEIGCSGVIVGKAIYEGKINLNELKEFNYAD